MWTYTLLNLSKAMINRFQLWNLRLVLYRLLLLVVIIVASILLLHLISVTALAGSCNPTCALPPLLQ